MIPLEAWEDLKRKFYERMIRDRYIGYLDPGIEEILIKIFRLREAFPTSSCSGRITAIDSIYPWIRKDSYVFFKKHGEITLEEMRSIIKTPAVNSIWVVVSGPIIHVNTYTLSEAVRILRTARDAGFKHSGILSRSKRGYIVEILSGIRLDTLVKTRDKILLREEDIPLIVETINKAYRMGRERIKRLEKALDKLLEDEKREEAFNSS
ncbi:MAG: hypothetical protein QXE32_01400 [Sulfolobales archaeon]